MSYWGSCSNVFSISAILSLPCLTSVRFLLIIDYIPEAQTFVSSGADRTLRFYLLPSLTFLRGRSVVDPQMAFAHIPSTSHTSSALMASQYHISTGLSGGRDKNLENLLNQTLTSQGSIVDRRFRNDQRPSDERWVKGVMYSGGQGCNIHTWDIATVRTLSLSHSLIHFLS